MLHPTDTALGAVSFDLDSTLCDTSPRHQMLLDGCTDYAKYSMECHSDLDGPALPAAQYLSAMGAPIVVCSARDNLARSLTLKWLYARGVKPWLMLLNEGEETGHVHGKWKAQKLLEAQAILGRKIVMHFDDYTDVAIETAKVGIPTILVHEPGKLGEFLA